MAKVVTSQGLTEFVQSGKFDTVANHKKGQPAAAAPLEAVKVAPTLDVSAPASSAAEGVNATPSKEGVKTATAESEHDEALTDEEKALPEKAQKEIQRAKRAVNKKHAEMMEAREDAAEDRRLAEQQFNERKLLEQRLADREAEIERLKPKAAPPVEAKAPDIKDFTNEQGQVDWDKYTDAKAEFKAKQAVEAERTRIADEQAKEANAKLLVKHTESETAAKKLHKDFDAVMDRVKGTDLDKPPRFVLGFLNESDVSGELRYYLATHTDETKKIFELSPVRGIKELGRIEDSLIKPSTAAKETPAARGEIATQRGAPPPITPLNGDGGAGINTDPSKMSFKELREYERSRRAKH